MITIFIEDCRETWATFQQPDSKVTCKITFLVVVVPFSFFLFFFLANAKLNIHRNGDIFAAR